jgi:hypothetical protein
MDKKNKLSEKIKDKLTYLCEAVLISTAVYFGLAVKLYRDGKLDK